MPIHYDKKVKRYRRNGRFIALKTIRDEIEKAVELTRRDMKGIGKRLADGKIDKSQWRDEMSDLTKALIIVAVAVGYGGRNQMTQSNWGKVGAKVKEQNKYLDRFEKMMDRLSANQIENRSGLYALSARSAYFEAEKEVRGEDSTLCRRIINSKEGCDECQDYTDWIPIDEMPDIGSLLCGQFCACDLEYE